MKLTAFVAALLLGTTALAQTAQDDARMKAAAAGPTTPAAPAAPAAAPAPTFTFALKGFASMSMAYQSGAFILSEGQQSIGSATGVSPVDDKTSLNFDVRQSRFNFSVKGPTVLFGATPTAVMEIDFMQGQGAGNFGDVSLLNRLRTLYTELNWGAHRLQFGQQNDLIFAMAPTSISHIAFPLGYFTGNLGWRRPGVFGYHTFTLPSELKLEAAWEVGRSQWADAAASIGGAAPSAPNGVNQGEASGAPAVEGRVTVNYSKYLTAFLGAHWNQVDLTGVGANGSGIAGTNTIAVTAYNAGVKLSLPLPSGMGLTIQGTGFTGQNIYPLVGNMETATFRLPNTGDPDVSTMGYWAQAGFNFTKELSLWGFYGQQKIDESDFVRSLNGAAPGATGVRFENATTNFIAMYREGGMGFSVEWINFATKYATAVSAANSSVTTSRTAKSDQYMFTATYFF